MAPPQSVTLTNTSAVALTWHATPTPPSMTVNPSTSTLPPGQAITMAITPPPYKAGIPAPSFVTIDADVAASQSINVQATYGNKPPPISLPPDVEFGNVKVGTLATAFVAIPFVSSTWFGYVASISGPSTELWLSGPTAGPQVPYGVGWLVSFKPLSVGQRQETITFNDYSMLACPPNTIAVRGVGVAP